MKRRGLRQCVAGFAVLAVLGTMAIVPLTAQGATAFAAPAFQQQWSSVESSIPNFWGPLETARDGQIEPYVEGNVNGQPGQRLVQYFDKARMELTNPATGAVSNGLLTVELKTGRLQLGDNSFQGQTPAQIGIAGDEGSSGPTYASLGLLMEREAQANGSVALSYDVTTGNFSRGAVSSDPNAVFATYLGDPNGRFGQNVPRAFADFLQRIPGGYLSAMGYPITPAFQANVRLAGRDNVPVIIQAFERKVLTYTPSNQAAFQVEFGNIGRHYFTWRYNMSSIPAQATATTAATGTATATITPTATANAATQTAVAGATQTTTAGTVGAGASAVQTAVSQTAAAMSAPTQTAAAMTGAVQTAVAQTLTAQAATAAPSQTAAAQTAAAMTGATQTAAAQTAAAQTAAAGAAPAQTAAAQTAAAQTAAAQTAAAQTAAAPTLTAAQQTAAAQTATASVMPNPAGMPRVMP